MEKLYHLMHREFEGDVLNPSQANPNDPEPYVYATSVLSECLPYATPNGTRIFNVTDPETGLTITLVPNRDDFLENGKIQGTIYELLTEGFTEHPTAQTQYVSKDPVAKGDMTVAHEISSIDDVMQLGLHVLFTEGAPQESDWDFYMDIMKDPEFPKNLKAYVDMGVFRYENAERGINPTSFLSSNVQASQKIAPQIKPQNKTAVSQKPLQL